MISIIAEGVNFRYVSASYFRKELISANLSEVEQELACANDVRLSYFQDILSRKWRLYWLVWQVKIDLKKVDFMIERGGVSDEYFVSSIRTQMTMRKCARCNIDYQVLLVDAGDSYPMRPELNLEKIQKMKIVNCPRCGSSFRGLVAKVVNSPL